MTDIIVPNEEIITTTTNNEHEHENENNNTNQVQRRIRRCGHCRESGHDINHCTIYASIYSNLNHYYRMWVCVVITDFFAHRWNYTDEIRSTWNPLEKKYRTSVLTSDVLEKMEFCKSFPENEALDQMLRSPTKYIQDLDKKSISVIYRENRTALWGNTNVDLRNIGELKKHLHWRAIRVADILLMENNLHKYSNERFTPLSVSYMTASIKACTIINEIGVGKTLTANRRIQLLHENRRELHDDIQYNRTRIVHVRDEIGSISRRVDNITQGIEKYQREIARLVAERTNVQNSRPRLQARKEHYREILTSLQSKLDLYSNIPPLPPLPPQVKFTMDSLESIDSHECAICLETKEKDFISKTNCNHPFCTSCILEHILTFYKKNPPPTRRHAFLYRLVCPCPLCRKQITELKGNNHIAYATLYELCEGNIMNYDSVVKTVGGEVPIEL